MSSSGVTPWFLPSLAVRAARGNSKEVSPVGVFSLHTAVPDLVFAEIFSQTKRYAPRADDCVRSTNMPGKLHSAWVASRLFPESSSITSGVRLIHHEGGSIFVTTGASGCETFAGLLCATAHFAFATKNKVADSKRT